MPFHKVYADGSPRPLLRGWLHGITTIVVFPSLLMWYTDFSSSTVSPSSVESSAATSSSLVSLPLALPAPAVPGLVAICMTLLLSSLVHLVPWRSAWVLEALVRLDKTGILAICGTSFWGPQLLQSHACKPSHEVAMATVAIPVSLAVLGTWCGLGPIVFVGCAIAFGQTLYFFGTQVNDDSFFVHSLACAALYGTGLALYVLKVGGHSRYWGYHEWMHLLVTLGFLVNARGLLLMSSYTDETCTGTMDTNNNTLENAAAFGSTTIWKDIGL